MRVIKKGILPETLETEVVCFKCKTEFAYTKNDIQRDSRDGDYVVCPSCETFIAAKDPALKKLQENLLGKNE